MGFVTVVVAVFVAVYAALALIAWRRPLLARLATREAVRRPWQSALLVAGLMTGSAAILAMSLVVDSAANLDVLGVELGWGHVDLQVTKGGGFFSRGVADELAGDSNVRSRLTGVQAGADLVSGVIDLDRDTVSPSVRIVGFDPSVQAAFGAFTLLSGRQTTGTDLGPTQVFVSKFTIDLLDAHAGDRLRISNGAASADVQIAGILQPKGAGLFGAGPGLLGVVYAPLTALAPVVPAGMINVVRLTAGGGGQTEIDRAHLAVPAVRAVLDRSSEPLMVGEVKADDLKVAGSGADAGRPFLTSFAVIILAAGTLLVVNLMFAVSEERRPRFAVLRALGLTRTAQVTLSVLEGSLYALAAGVVGILPGFLFAGVMWRQLEVNFGVPPDLVPLAPEVSSVVGAVAAGTLITLATVGLASFRGTRMSIAAAIKELPDRPGRPSRWRTPGVIALVLLGFLAVGTGVPAVRLIGGTVLISVAVLLAARRLRPRVRAAMLGLGVAAWNLVGAVRAGPGVGGSQFINWVLGVLLVTFGLAVVITAGYPLLERLTVMPGLGRMRAVTRPSLAYLSRRPVTTGLGVATIAVVLSFLAYTQQSEAIAKVNIEQTAGDFDLAVFASGSPDLTVPHELANQITEQQKVDEHVYVGSVRSYGPGADADITAPHQTLALLALTTGQLMHPMFSLRGRASQFASDADAWRAMAADPSLVLVNNNNNLNPGTDIQLQAASGPIHFRAIGAVNSPFANGVIGSEASFAAFDDLPAGELLLLKTAPSTNVAALARQIQRAVIGDGAEVVTRQQAVAQVVITGNVFWNLIGLLFTVGLLVGVASIGIIALRAVVVRKHAIGVLRSLGFGPAMVTYGLLLEALLTALAATVVGAGIGVFEIYDYVNTRHWTVSLDWMTLAQTVALILVAVILVTILPALQASRLAPAQALRIVD